MITMYPAKVNSPATTLASGINAAVTSIPLVHSSVLPAAPNLAAIGTDEDTETILYLTINGNNLENVTRGFQGVAKPWASGTQVARFLTAYDLDTLKANLEAHDPATTGVHGIGAGTIAKVGDIAVNANLSPTAQDAIAKKHAQGTDTALGAVGTKDPPIDADKALYRNSAAADTLVTSTWTQIKAFLKTYFDTVYSKLAHRLRHQSGGADEIDVTGLSGELADLQKSKAADIYSCDFGLNWADLGNITGSAIYAIIYLGNGIACLGTADRHVWRSTNYGATWADLGAITAGRVASMVYLGNGIAILGEQTQHVWRSTDYGLNWADLGVVASDIPQQMDYLGNGIAILGDQLTHVHRSTDYGATWADLGVISGNSIDAIAYLGNGIAILGDWDGHVFRSTDYGANWSDLGIIDAHTSISTMAYLGNGIVVLGDQNGYVFRSVDYGLTWTDLGIITPSDIFQIINLGNGIAIMVESSGHIYRSTDYGLNWTDLAIVTVGNAISTLYLGNGIAIVGDNTGRIYRSTSAFQVWNNGMTPHASEHENGGSDEIDVGGLSGELADLQKVKNHTHQAAGGGVGGKLDHGLALNGLADDDHPQYIKHSLATAISDFLVASGAGVFIKKTLAEVKTLLAHNTMHQNGGADEISVAGLSGELADGQTPKADIVDKTHLSQDFGASAGRLRNLLIEPTGGEIIRFLNAAASVFSGAINSAGSGGLTATNVPYDGHGTTDAMFNGLAAYDGSSYWGQIILHNTTRGNSRKIVSVDIGNDAIATTSSTDDWADDDVITCQSQTNITARYFDVDVSDNIPTTTDAILLSAVFRDNEGNADTSRTLYFHPYVTYDVGKRVFLPAVNANDQNNGVIPVKIVNQKFTMAIWTGCVDVTILTSVAGYTEYADT